VVFFISMKDPRTQFTRGIAEAVESTPAFEAMFSRSQIIPTTWGNLASQLVEGGHVEPTLDAARDFLGITVEEINDPTILGSSPYGYDHAGAVKRLAEQRWANEYQELHRDDDQGYLNYLSGQVDQWHVDDDGQADQLRAQIDAVDLQVDTAMAEASAAYRQMDPKTRMPQRDEMFAEADRLEQQAAILTLRHDALLSGVAVPFNDFAASILAYDGERVPSQERLMLALGDVVENLIDDYFRRSPEVRTDEVVLGESQISEFMAALERQQRDAIRAYADAKWQTVEHLFYAGDYREHPLFTGVHSS
jgi:hypothetical protein